MFTRAPLFRICFPYIFAIATGFTSISFNFFFAPFCLVYVVVGNDEEWLHFSVNSESFRRRHLIFMVFKRTNGQTNENERKVWLKSFQQQKKMIYSFYSSEYIIRGKERKFAHVLCSS